MNLFIAWTLHNMSPANFLQAKHMHSHTDSTRPVEMESPFLGRATTASEKQLEKLEFQIQSIEARVDELLSEDNRASDQEDEISIPAIDTVNVWGVPFARLTFGQTIRRIDDLIRRGIPSFFITANLNYNMLTQRDPELRSLNERADFIIADGMPMVWRSRLNQFPLPERVAGSELIYAISQWASQKGRSIYFLGGAPGVAEAAAKTLAERYSGLKIAGVHSPPFRPLSDQENDAMVAAIRDSNADILFVAFGQPKGEKWIDSNLKQLGVPVCVQIGASFDFVAGGVSRAPRWIQAAGMEWLYRLAQEPKRLFGRYFSNGLFLLRALALELFGKRATG